MKGSKKPALPQARDVGNIQYNAKEYQTTASRDALKPEDVQRVKRAAFWNLQEALKLDCTLALPLVGGRVVMRRNASKS